MGVNGLEDGGNQEEDGDEVTAGAEPVVRGPSYEGHLSCGSRTRQDRHWQRIIFPKKAFFGHDRVYYRQRSTAWSMVPHGRQRL